MALTVEPLLGTRAEVSITTGSPATHGQFEREVLDEVARLEPILSVFDESSALCQYRRTGTTAVAELLEVVDLAMSWHVRTDGAFHPGTQPLVDLWVRAESDGVMPGDDKVAATLASISTARRASSLNLNAIAKGWIADRALTDVVVRRHVASGWLSLGGDVVHRGEGAITVGIEDPFRPYDNAAPCAKVAISNEALATSGAARRWWQIGERRFPKVLDPRTGRPVDHVASATIVAKDGATADVLATVAVVLDLAETMALTAAFDADCYLVSTDGSTLSSSERFRPSSTRSAPR